MTTTTTPNETATDAAALVTQLETDLMSIGTTLLLDVKGTAVALVTHLGSDITTALPSDIEALEAPTVKLLLDFVPEAYRYTVSLFANNLINKGTAAFDAAQKTLIQDGIALAVARLTAIINSVPPAPAPVAPTPVAPTK